MKSKRQDVQKVTWGLILSVGLFATSAQATTFIVNSTADATDANPGDSVCATDEGACTLRAAIEEANAMAGLDLIQLPAGTYTLTLNGIMGEPNIFDDLTVTGSGAGSTIIDGAKLGRVFALDGPITVLIERVTITGGTGSGIWNGGSTLTIHRSTISQNDAIDGGGIYNRGGTVTISRSTISENMAPEGDGGGIFNFGGTVAIDNSTITQNTVEGDGDGGGCCGGGILNIFGGTLTVSHSTITQNRASEGGGGIHGGGVLTHAIVGGNTAPDSPDCSGGTSLGFNLVGTGTGCPSDGTGDQTVDPAQVFTAVLGHLTDNGGPTQTHALLPGSPAIDAVPLSGCPATDQRGVARPQDGDGDGIALCDIGAYELAPSVLEVAIDIKPGSFPNSINPRSKGVIPVAILTTDTFDATTVNPTTVRFGATGTEAAPVKAALRKRDVDKDGDIDVILHFETQETGIKCGDTSASLTGETVTGEAIEGSDSIKTAGCK